MPTKRVAIYARLSVATEESVSIERQVQACRTKAQHLGAEVVDVFTDDGISATHIKPEDRPGWRALMASPESFDAVVVWKVDRLARRVLDFLHADESLRGRKAAVLAVEDPIDMTTATGRAFGTMLAVFGEMEAAATSARVKAARTHLVKAGRVVGGTVPYGFRSIPNPEGSGLVLAQDPERIDWVRGMADRALRGDSIYSITHWLDDEAAPLPKASQQGRKATGWHYRTVERLLRSPVLAGMTPFNPGRGRHEEGTGVLRDEDGMPVVDESVAVIGTDEHRRILSLLDNRDTPQARPRTDGVTSELLSRLVTCGHCDRTMHRGTTSGRPSLQCPGCFQTVSRQQLDALITKRLLDERGHLGIWEHTEVLSDSSRLGDIESAIRATTEAMAQDDADIAALTQRLANLKDMRTEARSAGPSSRVWRMTGRTVAQAWGEAEDDLARRDVLVGQAQGITVRKGKVGRYLDRDRVEIAWAPEPVGLPLPDGQTLVEPLDGTPSGEGEIGGLLVTLDSHRRTYTSNRKDLR